MTDWLAALLIFGIAAGVGMLAMFFGYIMDWLNDD